MIGVVAFLELGDGRHSSKVSQSRAFNQQSPAFETRAGQRAALTGHTVVHSERLLAPTVGGTSPTGCPSGVVRWRPPGFTSSDDRHNRRGGRGRAGWSV